jgi:hypothetical protein
VVTHLNVLKGRVHTTLQVLNTVREIVLEALALRCEMNVREGRRAKSVDVLLTS